MGRTTATEIGERVEVEWELDAAPTSEWTEVFQFAAVENRAGPVDWIEGGGPDVVGHVRAMVRAHRVTRQCRGQEVAHRLDVANRRCFP